jgi:hypothetical protein
MGSSAVETVSSGALPAGYTQMPRLESSEKVSTPEAVPAAESPLMATVAAALAPPAEPPRTVALRSSRDALRSDGSLDFAKVYHGLGIATTTFAADQAIEALCVLPYELPVRMKRLALQATLSAVGSGPEAMIPQMVQDAARKLVGLNQFLDFNAARERAAREKGERAIARLELELEALRELLATEMSQFDAVRSQARARIDEMTGLIAFLDEWQDARNDGPSDRADEAAETPAYLRDESVLRLLSQRQKRAA